MPEKISVQMVEINNSYGSNVFLPYAVGILQAYFIKDNPDGGRFEFRPFLFPF